MPADLSRRNDDAVTRCAGSHEGDKVRHRAGVHSDLCELSGKCFRGKLGGDDLDLLDRLETHLILVARISQGDPRPEAARQQHFGLRVHDVGCRVQVDTAVLVNLTIFTNQVVDLAFEEVSVRHGGRAGKCLNEILARGWHPLSPP